MVFVFSRDGPVEEFGAAEELAEAPEPMEMPVVLWHVARCTGAEDLCGATEDFGGAGAACGIGREGLDEEIGREGIEEELGCEGIAEESGFLDGFLGIAFLLEEASVAAAAAAESSLNFFTTSLACLANLACRLAHSSA